MEDGGIWKVGGLLGGWRWCWEGGRGKGEMMGLGI